MSSNYEASPEWVPTQGVLTHLGNPLPEGLVFFAQPPADIGTILSAWSTVAVKPAPTGFAERLSRLRKALSDLGEPQCTFLGDRGWARASARSNRFDLVTQEHLLFEEAEYTTTDFEHTYSDTRKTGERYCVKWFDSGHREIGKIESILRIGVMSQPPCLPQDGHPLYFAQAAERLWLDRIMPAAEAALATKGPLVFPVRGSGRHAITISEDGVCIEHEDARFRPTVMRLKYVEMEPVQVFHQDPRPWGRTEDECFMIRKASVDKHQIGHTTVTLGCGLVPNVGLVLELLRRAVRVEFYADLPPNSPQRHEDPAELAGPHPPFLAF